MCLHMRPRRKTSEHASTASISIHRVTPAEPPMLLISDLDPRILPCPAASAQGRTSTERLSSGTAHGARGSQPLLARSKLGQTQLLVGHHQVCLLLQAASRYLVLSDDEAWLLPRHDAGIVSQPVTPSEEALSPLTLSSGNTCRTTPFDEVEIYHHEIQHGQYPPTQIGIG